MADEDPERRDMDRTAADEEDTEGRDMDRTAADEENTERGSVDRAAQAARKTAAGNAGRRHVESESGYAILEDQELQEMEELCSVLDFSYSQKLKDFGVKDGNKVKSRVLSEVLNFIAFLKREKVARFKELRRKSKLLIRVWKKSHESVKKKSLLDAAFALVDAESSDEISVAKFLRNRLEDELKTETTRLKLAQNTKKRTKYEARKSKLKNLMISTHLVPSDIGFEPDKKVEDKDLSRATIAMKSKIHEVKGSILDRKELVFRIQAVQDAISNASPFKTVRVLLKKAKLEACNVEASCPDLRFDGLEIAIFLSRLEKAASSVLDAAAELNLQVPPETIDFVRSTTRSGTRFSEPVPVTENADRERHLNKNEWNCIDKKRMLNVVYRVRDLDATIESYVSDFGMKLLRKGEDTERRCTFALVGFGPENTTFALKIAQCDAIAIFDIGDGFGNVGIACKVHEYCERIQTSGRCIITCRPAYVNKKKNSSLIAVAQECNGHLFELVEKEPFHQISHVMLRVNNLERSVTFYEKALGMKLIRKKDLPEYECAIAHLRYDGIGNITNLALMSNNGVEEYSKGDAFLEITIGTDNVERSLETVEKAIQEFGGKVLHRPGQQAEQPSQGVASFEDPNGFKVVLVDNENFLKEVAIHVADDPEVDASC